jgi:hypothetical protein
MGRRLSIAGLPSEWLKNGEKTGEYNFGFYFATFLRLLQLYNGIFMIWWLDFSDVLCRYPLGANPRGVTDSWIVFI